MDVQFHLCHNYLRYMDGGERLLVMPFDNNWVFKFCLSARKSVIE